MIIDSKQGDIEVVGDIKEFKTSIDPRNLEFITTLLSSNLYSDPEQSFIREIVSNAWDSHVEAGTTDTPVIISFRDEPGNKSVTIRDYGTGLSPERFQEVYCMIGSSTKRESNDFIGGFGIGKYSSLACSNTVYITSYYEGTAYYYVMVKSGNQITTNLLHEKPTAEKNGVEVTIKSISDLKPFNKALQYIVFFPNIYVNGAEDAPMINGAKLKRFKNFAAASMSKPIPSKLLLGNVLYKCDKYHLKYEAQQFLNSIENTGIVIKFDVGEINITPNRESIIYNADTIRKIEDRIMSAKKELESMIGATYTKDYDNIEEYFNNMSQTKYFDPVTETMSSIGYKFEPSQMETCSITYRGIDLKEDLPGLRNIFSMTLPNYKGVIDDDKILVKKMPWSMRDNNQIKTKKLLILNSGARLLASVKLYLKDHYDEYAIMTDLTYQEFEDWMNSELGSLSRPTSDHYHTILNGVYEALKAKAEYLDIDTDKDFLAFKEELSSDKLAGTIKEREAILYVWDSRGYKEKKSFKRLSQAIQYMKSLRKGIIFTGMDADESQLSAIAELKGYAFIKARKDIVQDVKKLNLSCMVDIDWLLYRDPLLSVVATLAKHFPSEMNTGDITSVCLNLTDEESNEFQRLVKIYKKYKENYRYYSIVSMKDHPVDPYTEYLCLRLKNYIKKHNEARAKIKGSGCESNHTMVTAVVMMSKGYKISSKAYDEVKNNKLIRVLCRKS